MLKIEEIEFPSKYLNCYESVLITTLKYQGLADETPLVGTQACFVFSPADFTVSPRYNTLDEELARLYDYQAETVVAADQDDLKNKLVSLLDRGVPVCLPVDIYSLPHTLHYQQLHQHHYVNIFGYDDTQYYMVCPYYRFQGWVDMALVHDGFFSPVAKAKGGHLICLPELKLPALSAQTVSDLVEENCRYMLNLAAPNNIAPQYLGLEGLRTFTQQFQQLVNEQGEGGDDPASKAIYINLSRQIMMIGYSRHWFYKLIQSYQPAWLTAELAGGLESQFTAASQAWNAIGMRLGMGVHGQRAGMMQRVVRQLEQVQEQESRLFNSLLGALPDYEWGTI